MNNISSLYADELERESAGTDFADEARIIADKLRSAADRTPSEISSLYPEILIVRQQILEGLKLKAEGRREPDAAKRSVILRNANAIVIESTKQIEKLCMSAAKIDSINKTSQSLQLAKSLVDHVCRVAGSVFVQVPVLRDRFIEEIRSSIVIQEPTTNVQIERTRDKYMAHMDGLTAGRFPG